MEFPHVGALIGGAMGGVIAMLMNGTTRPHNCPDCGETQPRIRWPASARQALRGGWTCRRCGCEMDRVGKKLERRS
jgi:hypothetical protein